MKIPPRPFLFKRHIFEIPARVIGKSFEMLWHNEIGYMTKEQWDSLTKIKENDKMKYNYLTKDNVLVNGKPVYTEEEYNALKESKGIYI